jgi:ribosomal protein L29
VWADFSQKTKGAKKTMATMTDAEREQRIAELEAEIKTLRAKGAEQEVDQDQPIDIDGDRLTQLKEQIAAMNQPSSQGDRNEAAAAFVRADSVYQMLSAATPMAMPGERPLAYRKRLAHGLLRYAPRFAKCRLDALDSLAFGAVESEIYNDAVTAAKESTHDKPGLLREVKRTVNGKTICEFYGDGVTAWLPFMPPTEQYFRICIPQDTGTQMVPGHVNGLLRQ